MIGVFGAWGSGKTTTLQFVEASLKAADADRFPVVWFNPWRYGSEELLVQGLFETLADAISTSLPTVKDKIADWLQKAGGAAGGLSLSVLGGQAGVGSGLAAAGRLLSQRSLETDRDRLNVALRAAGKRVVVMIDDIDRLDKNEIVTILRAVKLAADFHNLVYILAFDRAKVAAALADRYPGQSGSDFLDKMVQLPLSLPRADPSIVRERLLRDIDKLLERHRNRGSVQFDSWRLVSTLDTSVLPRVRTARDHTLYLNAVEFAIPAHRGELNVTDIILLEALRLFYPDAYQAVSRDKETLVQHGRSPVGGEEALRQLLNSIDVSPDEGTGPIHRLLQALFPQFEAVFTSSHHEDSDVAAWTSERRVCSDRYFDRYFTYGLPSGDVADSTIDELIGKPHPAGLRSLLTDARPGIVIAKLHDRANSIRPEQAVGLVEAIGATAQILPALASDRDLSSPRARASVLTVRLLSRIPESDRAEVARRLLLHNHVEFAVLVLNWLRDSATSADAPLPAEAVAELRKAFADRLLDLDLDSPLVDNGSVFVPLMYALMFEHDNDRASRQLAGAMKDGRRLAQLLAMFMPSAFSASGSPVTSLPGTIEREAFYRMGQVVPLDVLLAAAKELAMPTPASSTEGILIERFITFAEQRARSAEIDLPVIKSEFPHPLANHGPSVVVGGVEPHAADFAVRVAVLIPDLASLPHPPPSPISRLTGRRREAELIQLLAQHPITHWLKANISAFGATSITPWAVAELRGDDFTTITAELLDDDDRVPVRATATFNTGISERSEPARPCLLANLDISFALLGRDGSRHHTDTRHDATPTPAPAALKLAELAGLLHAAFGTFDTAWQAARLLLPPAPPRAAIGIWIVSRNGLDRVIDTSHLRVLSKISSSQQQHMLYRQLAKPALGEPAIEQMNTPDMAIAAVSQLLGTLNCRDFEAELFAIRTIMNQP